MDMAAAATSMKKTLGLTGVTVNAMALIAPGAFLWITYQVQAAQTLPGSNASTAMDIWPGILFALILAFLTALSYAELARIYPESGTGSSYYFAERSFLDKEDKRHHRWARLAKLATGWAAHLYYWVYPGVMVSFMTIIVAYMLGLFGVNIGEIGQIVVAIVFAGLVGYIAVRGVTGSTTTALVINVIQLVSLIGFSALAIAYRFVNPDHATFVFSGAGDVVLPHDLFSTFAQATIAILILVGFETATAFGAEAKNVKRDIPRAIVLALVIQGLFAYLFEYFAANFAISDKLTGLGSDGKTVITGLDAAAASSAPIGDMVQQIGNSMFGGVGFALTVVVGFTVILAILGTTLSAINTGVRVTFAMAQDQEMPGLLGLLHGSFATPHFGVLAICVVSGIIGIVGTFSVVTLTGITLASNFGTFTLYGLTCLVTVVAFLGHREFGVFKHIIVPVLGFLANIVMLVTIFALGFLGGGDSQTESFMALGIAGGWLVLNVLYIALNRRPAQRAVAQRSAV
jgi:amino acid transporter